MRLLVVTLLVSTGGLALAPTAGAQARVTLVPSLSISSVYDDNLFARQRGDAGEMTLLRPGLETTYEAPRLTLLGGGSFDMQRSNHTSLNTLDARRNAYLDTRLRSTPATTILLTGRYDQTQTPGELNLESGILGNRQEAQRFQVTPAISHRMGPRATATASYDWISEMLTGSDRISLRAVRGSYGRQISTRDTVSGGVLVRHFLDDFGAESSAAVLAGWTRQLGEGTQFTVQGGPRLTSYAGIAPEVTATFMHTVRRMKLGVDYWHGETIVLGIHGPVKVDTTTAKFMWPLTRRIELGAQAGVSDILTLDQREATSYRTTMVGSWSPGGPFIVAGSYGVDLQKGDIRRNLLLDSEVLRHVFRVSLTIAPRISRSIQPTDGGPSARPRR